MAKQVINIGTTPGDNTGDPLRTAFNKVNDNFAELYAENAAQPKIYKGLLSQAGTAIPIADTVFKNDLTDVTFNRSDVGTYSVASSDINGKKTYFAITKTSNDYDIVLTISSDDINILTYSTATGLLTDEALLRTPFLIEVYP
jgi:hypothetical protein